MKRLLPFAAALAAAFAWAGPAPALKVSADRVAADHVTGALAATGHVRAAAYPVTLHSESVSRDAQGEFVFADPTELTTCTNAWDDLHWQISGEVSYRDRHHVLLRNAWVRLFDMPVCWLPCWYYPMDTEYGWRVMPAYSSRWGASLLTKYVYGLCGSMEDGAWGLAGNTRLDLRTKNGVALGETVKWNLGDTLGRGKFKVYYAWDDNADRYDRHWNDLHKWNYSNWGSTVPDERYGLSVEHRAEPTERDSVWLKAAHYSDSHFHSDFLRQTMLGSANEFATRYDNEVAWEHVENPFALGASVSGPLADFYPGVASLPDVYFDVNPQPVWTLPVNYESQTRFGYYDRDYAKYGNSRTADAFRYSPGPWANYNAARLDTYHRLTLPMKFADVLSAVPRFGVRETWWSDTGYLADSASRAGSTGDGASRAIFEGGVTFSARGSSYLGDGVTHVVEPYLDALAQEANVSGLGDGERLYQFDSIDSSSDWLDQFAGRSRNLPYSYVGVTPGLRNQLRVTEEDGTTRTYLDFDTYCAVQFNDTSYTPGNRYHRLVRDQEDPLYGEDDPVAVPGIRVRWLPEKAVMLSGRIEYDTESSELAYANLRWSRQVWDDFGYYVSYWGRNHRRWDYSSSIYDRTVMEDDDFNWAHYQFLEAGCEHEICDAVAWSPFVRWDCREGELDEIGAWLDLRTDCLGFRFSVGYENDYTRVDGSEYDHDWSFGFFIYLRALGPSTGAVFGD